MSRGALDAAFPLVGAAASSAGLTINAMPPAARKPRRLIFFADAVGLDFTGCRSSYVTGDYPRFHFRARAVTKTFTTRRAANPTGISLTGSGKRLFLISPTASIRIPHPRIAASGQT